MEGRQGRGRCRFGWLDGVKRALAIREVGLQEATQLTREKTEERTCEGVIVLTQSEEGRDLRVIVCLFCMSCRSHAGGDVYDGTVVNQLRLSGPVPEIGVLLPALIRVGVGF